MSRIEALGRSAEVLKELEEPVALRVHRQDGSFEEELTYPRPIETCESTILTPTE